MVDLMGAIFLAKRVRMSAINLKEVLRKRVLDDVIRQVNPKGKWKLLVVDSSSAKLLNTICKQHEILQENVTVIEDLNQKRSSYPTFEAIYFVTPLASTIDKIIHDFKDNPIYLAGHIFFTSCNLLIMIALTDALFAQIKSSGTAKYFKTLRELNIDFHGTLVFTKLWNLKYSHLIGHWHRFRSLIRGILKSVRWSLA